MLCSPDFHRLAITTQIVRQPASRDTENLPPAVAIHDRLHIESKEPPGGWTMKVLKLKKRMSDLMAESKAKVNSHVLKIRSQSLKSKK
jgi:hypothetical protein